MTATGSAPASKAASKKAAPAKRASKKAASKKAGGKGSLVGELAEQILSAAGKTVSSKGADKKKAGPVTVKAKSGKPVFGDDQLVEQFLALQKEVAGFGKRLAPLWIRQGKLLIALKSQTKAGDWSHWVEDRLKITVDWASRLMQIGRAFDQVPKLPDGMDATATVLLDAARAKKRGASEETAMQEATAKRSAKNANDQAIVKAGKSKPTAAPPEDEPEPPAAEPPAAEDSLPKDEEPGRSFSDAFALVGITGPAAALAKVKIEFASLAALVAGLKRGSKSKTLNDELEWAKTYLSANGFAPEA